MHRRIDPLDLFPGHAHGSATRDERRETPQPAAPLPDRRSDEDRSHARPAVAEALELEVVDVAAASAFAVDELMIEQTQAEVELPR